MNWDRAKTILIAAFLALDLFLGYVAFGRPRAYSEITALEVSRAVEAVRSAGLEVAVDLPRSVLAAPFLSVQPRALDPLAAAQKLLGTTRPQEVQSGKELIVWSHNARRVTWVSSGAVLYMDETDTPGAGGIDARSARAAV